MFVFTRSSRRDLGAQGVPQQPHGQLGDSGVREGGRGNLWRDRDRTVPASSGGVERARSSRRLQSNRRLVLGESE